jgi:hypothetical protein
MRALIVMTLVLAGCATPAERAAQAERDVEQMMAVYGPACEKLGYQGASDPWRSCVLRLAERESLERYGREPLGATCFGHRGFFTCNRF